MSQYIIGDNSPHDLWNETWVSQYQATDYLVSYLSERLPNTLIYPALGNHGRASVVREYFIAQVLLRNLYPGDSYRRGFCTLVLFIVVYVMSRDVHVGYLFQGHFATVMNYMIL